MGRRKPRAKKVGGTSAAGLLPEEAEKEREEREQREKGEKEAGDQQTAEQFEAVHVGAVYDAIASHFSDTRAALWPIVARFCTSVAGQGDRDEGAPLESPSAGPRGAVVADIGCGNGKYMGPLRHGWDGSVSTAESRRAREPEPESASKSTEEEGQKADEAPGTADESVADILRFAIGVDRSAGLLKTCVGNSGENAGCLVQADGVSLPLRSGCCDASISIAVVHHFSSAARRLGALRELCRIVRPGGYVLVTVWALEQANKTFPDQDVFVPWHYQHRFSAAESSDKPQPPAQVQQPIAAPGDGGGNGPVTVFQRYYHLFVEGELEGLFRQIEGVEIVESAYDRDNYYVTARKTAHAK
jgi:tRNA (uracil-5-)-methyltransferase TRM9